jgi:hypothetical protein
MKRCIWTYLVQKEKLINLNAYRIGIQSMMEYAIKVKASFIVHTDPLFPDISPYYERFAVAKQANMFDRVLVLGSDIVIKPDAPNIFDQFTDGIYALDQTVAHKSVIHTKEFLQRTFEIYNINKKATEKSPMWNSCVVICNGSDLKSIYDFHWSHQDQWHDLCPYNANIYQKNLNVKNLGNEWNCFMSRRDADPFVKTSHFIHFDWKTKDLINTYNSYAEAIDKCDILNYK